MSSFRVLCGLLLLSAVVLGVEVDNRPKPTTKSTSTTSTTTTSTTTTSTTAAPIITTTPTTTTTTTPATTTSTSTTTAMPITTTAPPPSPPPLPEKGKWAMYDNNSISCVIIQIAAQLNITYLKKDNTEGRAIFNMPVNSTVSKGSCEEAEQFITIQWSHSTENNTVAFYFSKNSSANQFCLTSMKFNISKDPVYFPNAKDSERVELTHTKIFTAPLQKSYRCAKKQIIEMEQNSSVTIKDLQIEAFHKDKGILFDSATDCDSDVPDVVPIAVGCALGALVLIILITYLVGRRRSQTSGYLSM